MKPKILRTDAELNIIEQYMDQVSKVARVETCESYDADEIARRVAGKLSLQAKDYSAKFPSIKIVAN